MGSSIDQLYQDLFGEKVKKGEAYERISAAVIKLLENDSKVFQDKRIRGDICQTLFQIDVSSNSGSEEMVGEAKDYTDRDDKVGRGDIQKLAGALSALQSVDKGAFFSATSYTKPAIKYANSLEQVIGKKVDLYDLRPSVESDLDGRITKIVLNFLIPNITEESMFIHPAWKDDSIDKLIDSGIISEGKHLPLDYLYDRDNKRIAEISDLIWGAFPLESLSKDGGDIIFSIITNEGYLLVNNNLLGLNGLQLKVPYTIEQESLEIYATGTPKILIKDINGNVNKLITDEQIKSVVFNENNEALIKA